ncbi:MAG: class I SAM-dependent RNA methyltransferase [Paracoccaceae bacterium]|jgi:putative N6-adenine-specific DNA methylase|nr:class I SAM-dependent RNA methyltransferase [Paracoccaceae bacterium]
MPAPFEIFVSVPPGFETLMQAEMLERGFTGSQAMVGGVAFKGHWNGVWRANLELRGASRILARISGFRIFHLAKLDELACGFPWTDTLRTDVPVKVEVTCKKSKIYHEKAAAERIEKGLRSNGIQISAEADLVLKVRIENDYCQFSIDTSGEALHRRGFKEAVGKAPMRENLASLFLRACGYDGTETVIDPMCGSGTFPIEAAEIAMGLNPGRERSFAFEDLATFKPDRWADMRAASPHPTDLMFYGSDRDTGAIANSKANAERAEVDMITEFCAQSISDIQPPKGAKPGLVIINPPYGTRIGNKKPLFALYGSMGKVLKERFQGWRVGIITSDAGLAKSTGLPFKPERPSFAHGGIKVQLFQTNALKG